MGTGDTMTEFTEKHHAFIAACFYDVLTTRFGKRGKKAFIHATIRYAEQRGSRMAQRAIRDGRELDYATYKEYGEWVNTQTVKDEGCDNRGYIKAYNPDFIDITTSCPWATQFKEMGMEKGGTVYCQYLDPSIVRGFNPELTYITDQSLHEHDCCIQRVLNSGLPDGFSVAKKKEYLVGFDYHCGHNFKTYSQISRAIFGTEGELAANEVLQRFADAYGKDMADVLVKYLDTDFDLTY